MSLLKPQSLLKHPQTHTQSFRPPLPWQASLGYHFSGKEIEVRGSASSRSFPVICAQVAGLLQFPAPSAVSRDLQFLIQNHMAPSHGPLARVLLPLSFPARSRLVPVPSPALSLLLLKPCGKWSPETVWFQPAWLLCLGLNPGMNLPL